MGRGRPTRAPRTFDASDRATRRARPERSGAYGDRPVPVGGGIGIAEHVAPAPDRLDIVGPARRLGQFLAKLADEHVDDFQLKPKIALKHYIQWVTTSQCPRVVSQVVSH